MKSTSRASERIAWKWIALAAPVLLVAPYASVAADRSASGKGSTATGRLEIKDGRFSQLVSPDAKIEILAGGFAWSEGPVWVVKGGYLLFSDVPANSIHKWKPGEGLSLFMHPSGYTGQQERRGGIGSNGLALDPRGRLVLCEHGDRRVARLESLDHPNGAKTTLADRYKSKRFNSPNDLVFHSNGDLYFTDPPYGLVEGADDPQKELDFQGVYRLSGKGELALLCRDIERPNGIALSPDEKTLYVANSDQQSACWYAFAIQPDGTITGKRVFYECRSLGDRVPDGLTADMHGNLFATGPGGVCVFSPEGTHLGTIHTTHFAANCTWGDDGSTLYITAAKYLMRVRTRTRGPGF